MLISDLIELWDCLSKDDILFDHISHCLYYFLLHRCNLFSFFVGLSLRELVKQIHDASCQDLLSISLIATLLKRLNRVSRKVLNNFLIIAFVRFCRCLRRRVANLSISTDFRLKALYSKGLILISSSSDLFLMEIHWIWIDSIRESWRASCLQSPQAFNCLVDASSTLVKHISNYLDSHSCLTLSSI